MVGLFSATKPGLSGATLQMVNHGITSGVLFLIVGMIEARRGTSHMRALGGLWEQMPLFGRFFLIALLSSVGLPLTNGFVGEFLILLGAFQTYPILAAIATTGVIWSAVYMLQMFQKVMYGPAIKPEVRRMPDISQSERLILLPFILLIFLLGIQPGVLQGKIDQALDAVLAPAPRFRAVNTGSGNRNRPAYSRAQHDGNAACDNGHADNGNSCRDLTGKGQLTT